MREKPTRSYRNNEHNSTKACFAQLAGIPHIVFRHWKRIVEVIVRLTLTKKIAEL